MELIHLNMSITIKSTLLRDQVNYPEEVNKEYQQKNITIQQIYNIVQNITQLPTPDHQSNQIHHSEENNTPTSHIQHKISSITKQKPVDQTYSEEIGKIFQMNEILIMKWS